MLGKSISGSNNCFVCSHKLNWGTMAVSRANNIIVQDTPEVEAQETAIGLCKDF